MGRTTNLGFQTFGGSQGGTIADSGSKFSLRDPQLHDALFQALMTHSHNPTTSQLQPPSAGPSLAVVGGGNLPGGLQLFYRIAYIDAYGLETSASPEASVTTTGQLPTPSPPQLTVSAGTGLANGTHYYAIAWVDANGATTAGSVVSSASITNPSSYGQVSLTLPVAPAGAVSAQVYRQSPGDPYLYYITTTTATSIVDTGIAATTGSIMSNVNTTSGGNAIAVSLPVADVRTVAGVSTPLAGISRWRIYVTEQSGAYPDQSMVHEVAETAVGTDSANYLITSFTDTGSGLLDGVPMDISTAFQPPPAIVAAVSESNVAVSPQSPITGTTVRAALTYLAGKMNALVNSIGRTWGTPLVGTAPASPSTNLLAIQGGTWVQAVNSSGRITVTFPSAFVSSLLTVLVRLGDNNQGPLEAILVNSTVSLTGFTVQVYNGAGTAASTFTNTGTPLRLNWVALGY